MSMRTYVVGLGQPAAGDDGVGFAVLEELRRRAVPDETELLRVSDATDLISLLEGDARVVLVDAVLASPAGVVMELAPEDLSQRAPQPASSHGISAAQAIELTPAPNGAPPHIRVVAVTIGRPESLPHGAIARGCGGRARGRRSDPEPSGRLTMHEWSLARQILDAVLDRAGTAAAQRVGTVHGRIVDNEVFIAPEPNASILGPRAGRAGRGSQARAPPHSRRGSLPGMHHEVRPRRHAGRCAGERAYADDEGG
jgi:hydrogenase maturation protease